MTTYIVTRKSDGQEVYRYGSPVPIEWNDMGFATHDHTAQADPEVVADPIIPDEWRIYVGPFFDRFGPWKLAILSSTDATVQAVIKDCSVRKYIHLYERRADLLQVIGLLKSKGFAVDESAVLDVKPTAAEVFHG